MINMVMQPLNKVVAQVVSVAALVVQISAICSAIFLAIFSVAVGVVVSALFVAKDLRYDLEITLEEAVKGTTKDIQINTLAHCDSCGGSGAEKVLKWKLVRIATVLVEFVVSKVSLYLKVSVQLVMVVVRKLKNLVAAVMVKDAFIRKKIFQ